MTVNGFQSAQALLGLFIDCFFLLADNATN
ncbi:hypothetical protein N175_04790 [Vibrio anguillarum M3]|nr:hypothetical protein N175_04790 [Vibrio anguillarum M3]